MTREKAVAAAHLEGGNGCGHGNAQAERLPGDYERYLENAFRTALRLVGTPLKIELRSAKNPFAGQRRPAPKGRDKRGNGRTRRKRGAKS